MGDSIIKILRRRQEQIPYLYSPSNIEIYTPLQLVGDMLDHLPIEIWSNYTLKFVDPACKSGIFLSEVIIRLMGGLKDWEPDEHKRYDHIIKNMIFGYAYTELGYKITKKLLYGNSNYTCENIKLKWFNEEKDLELEFNVIVGNPPYNASRKKANGNTIWPDFVKTSLKLLSNDGYLCLVHPPGWRKPESDFCLWNLLFNKILYLSTQDKKTGEKIFGASTRFDWYILKNSINTGVVEVKDEKGFTNSLNLSEWQWLPSSNFELVKSILVKQGEKAIEIIQSTEYRTDKPWISRDKEGVFIYPVFLSNTKEGIRLCYSSKKLGHFGVPKVICNGGEFIYPVNDFEGKYGINAHSFGIKISTKEEGDEIIEALNSKKFQDVLLSTKWSNYQVDYRMFKCFKKDFWKEFVNEKT